VQGRYGDESPAASSADQQQPSADQQSSDASDKNNDAALSLGASSSAGRVFGSAWALPVRQSRAKLGARGSRHSSSSLNKQSQSSAHSCSAQSLFSWPDQQEQQELTQQKQQKQSLRLRSGLRSSLAAGGEQANQQSQYGGQSSQQQSNAESDQQSSADSSPSALDLKIARAFGVTPAEVTSGYAFNTSSAFSLTGQRPGVVHYMKSEIGPIIVFGSPMTAMPSAAVLLSPDIRLSNGLIHITDRPNKLPKKASRVMRANGLNAFAALAEAAGQQTADAVEHTAAVTILAPQDSALADITRRLPKQQLQRLIEHVHKYQRKVQRAEVSIRQQAQEAKQGQQGQQGQQSQQRSDDSDQQQSNDSQQVGAQQQQSNDAQQSDSQQQSGGFHQQQPQQQSDSTAQSQQQLDFSVQSARLHSPRMQPLRSQLRYGSNSDSSSATSSRSSGSSSSAALANAIASLKGELSFDLAQWCSENGVGGQGQDQQSGGQQSGSQQSSMPRRGGRNTGPASAQSAEQDQPLNPQQIAQLVMAHVFKGVTYVSEGMQSQQQQRSSSSSSSRHSIKCATIAAEVYSSSGADSPSLLCLCLRHSAAAILPVSPLTSLVAAH